MNKNLQHPLKTVLISSLASVNVIIWYDLLGAKFLLVILLLGLIIVLTSKTENA